MSSTDYNRQKAPRRMVKGLFSFVRFGLAKDRCLILCAALFGSVQLAYAQSPAVRTLVFPDDLTVGRLVILPDNFSLINKHVVGTALAPARGAVRVPARAKIMLIADDTLTDRAECLDKLPPDAFAALLLDKTTFGDKEVSHLKHLSGLKYLDLSGTDLSDQGIGTISGLGNLGFLDISHTAVRGLTFDRLGALKQLQFLNIGFNDLDSKAFVTLGQINFGQLSVLQASASRCKDSDVINLAKISNIRSLELTDCKDLTDKGLAPLRQLKKIINLDLRRTSVTPKGVLQLAGGSLRAVALPVDKFSDEDLKTFKRVFPALSVTHQNPDRTVPKELFEPLH